MHIDPHSGLRQNSTTVPLCQGCEIAGRFFILLYKSARDSIQYSGACLVAAAASQYFFSSATIPLLTISGTIFLTRTVVRILKAIPSEKVKALRIATERHLYDLDKKTPKLCYIVLIASVVASPFFPSASITLGLGYGIYKGLRIEIERTIRPPRESSEAFNANKNKPLI
jgi:hypothetical protein